MPQNWFSFLLGLNPNQLAIHLLVWVVAALATFGGGVFVGWETKSGFVAREQVTQLQHDADVINKARALQRDIDRRNLEIAVRGAVNSTRVKEVTNTIVREIHDHVTEKADRECVLTLGFNRVYNASLQAKPITQLALPAGTNDDTPSGFPVSSTAVVIASNNGTCKADHNEVALWHEWYEANRTVYEQAQQLAQH